MKLHIAILIMTCFIATTHGMDNSPSSSSSTQSSEYEMQEVNNSSVDNMQISSDDTIVWSGINVKPLFLFVLPKSKHILTRQHKTLYLLDTLHQIIWQRRISRSLGRVAISNNENFLALFNKTHLELIEKETGRSKYTITPFFPVCIENVSFSKYDRDLEIVFEDGSIECRYVSNGAPVTKLRVHYPFG